MMKFPTDRHERCVAKNERGRGDERERLERRRGRGWRATSKRLGGLSEFRIGSSIAAQLYVQTSTLRIQVNRHVALGSAGGPVCTARRAE
jgi:hypothetical protein